MPAPVARCGVVVCAASPITTHPAAMPRRRQQKRVHRPVVDPARIVDVLAHVAHHLAAEIGNCSCSTTCIRSGVEPLVVPDRLHQEQEHLVARMRIDAGLGLRPVEHLHAVDRFRPRHGRAPDRKPGEIRLRHIVEHEIAHGRADAVAADHEIVCRARRPSLNVTSTASDVLVERGDGAAERDRSAELPARRG